MVVLHTPRLILRDFCEDDWRAVHAYASDPEVIRYMTWGPNDEAASKAFVQAVMEGQNAEPRQNYDLAIILKNGDQLIGGCGIYRRKFREGEMGYCLHRSYWSKGYMTEAAQALLEFAFTEEDYHRVYATCDPKNIGSARVMEKIGMRKEGHLRANLLKGNEWRDSLLYAILASEWRELHGKV
ncbi:MAG: GNAT family N-acetyltransferase [Firmicutes bacterium]|nr:GNAT family N-acetyltransferase [Bacillota bacterium]